MIGRILRTLRIRHADRARADITADTRRSDRAERGRLAKKAHGEAEARRLRELRELFEDGCAGA